MTTKTAPMTVGEAQARLSELEERIAAGGPVTADEWAAAEAAVKLAGRIDDARAARDAAAAETARLAEVADLARRVGDDIASLNAATDAAQAAVVEALEELWRVVDDSNRMVTKAVEDVRRLKKTGPTPGLDVYRGPFGGWVVTVGGRPVKHGVSGGVSAEVSSHRGRSLAVDAVNKAAHRRGHGYIAGRLAQG